MAGEGKSARRRAAATTKASSQEVAAPTAAEVAPTPAETKPANHVRNLTCLTILIGGPYLIWITYLYIHLQSGLLRAPVSVNGTRQVLIIGTQSSGTTEMSSSLQALGLEVAHESSDTMWSFARDGTVSWLHMLRFMPGLATSDSLTELCRSSRRNMGFHVAMFRVPQRGCSYRAEWDACWRNECVELVSDEWGCASRSLINSGTVSTSSASRLSKPSRRSSYASAPNAASSSFGGACETPYLRTLLQVRHPLRVAESLSVKFCESLDSSPHPHLRSFLRALWPAHAWDTLGCAATAGWYWVLYNEAMMEAHSAGTVDGWYQVERSTPCAVARRAGFMEADTSVDHGAHLRATAACQSASGGGGNVEAETVSAEQAPDGKRRKNQVNKGRLKLTMADVVEEPAASGTGADLGKRMRKLAARFDYVV